MVVKGQQTCLTLFYEVSRFQTLLHYGSPTCELAFHALALYQVNGIPCPHADDVGHVFLAQAFLACQAYASIAVSIGLSPYWRADIHGAAPVGLRLDAQLRQYIVGSQDIAALHSRNKNAC